jgi:hypothetical protein
MNFTECLYRLDAYHTAFLESGSRDDVSLDFAVNAAAKALALAPPARLAILDPGQQQEVVNLRQLHEQTTAGASWDQPSRLAWLKQALDLLHLLRG